MPRDISRRCRNTARERNNYIHCGGGHFVCKLTMFTPLEWDLKLARGVRKTLRAGTYKVIYVRNSERARHKIYSSRTTPRYDVMTGYMVYNRTAAYVRGAFVGRNLQPLCFLFSLILWLGPGSGRPTESFKKNIKLTRLNQKMTLK